MLDSVKLKTKMDKKTYKQTYDALVGELVLLQQQARTEGLGLVVLVEGWKGAGKGSCISDLVYNLDARSTDVVSLKEYPDDVKKLFFDLQNSATAPHPFMKQFWQSLGGRGSITFYERGWFSMAETEMVEKAHRAWYNKERKNHANPLHARGEMINGLFEPCEELGGATQADLYLDSIASWERSLCDNGYKVVKLFIHATKKELASRLEDLYNNPDTRWRVSDEDMLSTADYEWCYTLHDNMLERSNFEFAPWTIVNGMSKRIANVQIAQAIVKALKEGLAEKREKAAQEPVEVKAPQMSRFPICSDYPTLENVDRNLKMDPDDYKRALKEEQKRLFKLEIELYRHRIPLMVMYEGWDAAGKGGAIKRVAQALDARAYKIYPSPAPSAIELAHPHLWRYWTRMPEAGMVGIYDRSWYGRVLVERVEGYAKPEEWARSYDEINEFERDIVDWGAILVKFWVEVIPEEQLRRFQDRQEDPSKQWKITEDDWRNRDKYPQYYDAVQDMFRLTSTTYAPWTVLEGDDKMYARIKSLRTISEAIEKRLGLQ